MSAPAVLALLPPIDLRDRTEGWGQTGTILKYSNYRDTGIWPITPQGHILYDEEPETSDTRDNGWWRSGQLLD